MRKSNQQFQSNLSSNNEITIEENTLNLYLYENTLCIRNNILIFYHFHTIMAPDQIKITFVSILDLFLSFITNGLDLDPTTAIIDYCDKIGFVIG